MKISAKTDYACRALLELSLHWPKSEPLPIHAIAQKQKIPIKFLIHIMIQLKQLGHVDSIRGKTGGYVLTKPPKEIILSDVIKGFAEMQFKPRKKPIKSAKADIFQSIWQEADFVLINFLGNINFNDLVQKDHSLANIAMYTI